MPRPPRPDTRRGRPQRKRPDRTRTRVVELEIDGIAHGGDGVGRLLEDGDNEGRGKAVFVPGALPDERVLAEIVQEKSSFARARLLEVLRPADGRVEPPCAYVPECGGCDLQHASPATGRALKTRIVREQLLRLGRLDDPPVDDCVAVGPDLGYRRHATLRVDDDGGVGFLRRGSNDVVPIDTCVVLTDGANALVDASTASGATEMTVHDADRGRAVALQAGPGALHLPSAPDDANLDVLAGQPDGSLIALRGDGMLITSVPTARFGALDYRHDPSCFFQVSPGAAGAIVDAVLDAVGDPSGALVHDLYAGVGLLAIALARAGADVVAVEGNAAATARAEENVEAHAADGMAGTVRVVTADVREHVQAEQPDAPDVVVLDPPRSGAGAEVVDAILAQRPGDVVYVACDPAALARDVRRFTEGGYRLVRARPLDVFPMTHHVEVVAHLQAG